MAISDKLTKLSDDISSAYTTIETMGGTIPTDKNTNNLPTAISSIPQGTPTTTGKFRVRFYDCDGTILKEEWVNKGEDATPPATPNFDPDRLTFRAWNHSYTNIQGNTSTGALYTVNDHAIYYFVEVNPLALSVSTSYYASTEGTVDWGDGTVETLPAATSSTTLSHTYSTAGKYMIKISGTTIYSDTTFNNSQTSMGLHLLYAYIGNEYKNSASPLFYCTMQGYGGYFYVFDSNIKAYANDNSTGIAGTKLNIIILNDIENIFSSNYAFGNINNYSSNKNILVLNNNCTSVANNAGQYGYAFTGRTEEIDNMHQITSINAGYAFNGSWFKYLNLKSLQNLYSGTSTSTFGSCAFLEEVYFEKLSSFPNSSNVFSSCYELKSIILNKNTMVTLGGTNALKGLLNSSRVKIYVPDSLYDAYLANSYWSAFSGIIKKISELPTTSHFYAYVNNN